MPAGRSVSVIDVINRFRAAYYRLRTQLFYRFCFASIGNRTTIYKPLFLSGVQYATIGSRVLIGPGVRMELLSVRAGRNPRLTIGDNTNIEQHVHIICHNKITIGANVSITGFCSIVDTTHPVNAPDGVKIGAAIADDDAEVEIGDGAFIGIGSMILPGVRIGKRAVIGANSVVTKDVPDGCIAAGVPATIRRRAILEQ